MTEQPSPGRPADASRGVYVWWGVALALLLALGAFCWLFLLPVLQVRALLHDESRRGGSLAGSDCVVDSDPDGFVRLLGGPEAAAYELGRMGPAAKSAVPALMRTARDHGSSGGRGAAIAALGQIGPDAREAVPWLEEVLGDPDQAVAECARGALLQITGREATKLGCAETAVSRPVGGLLATLL
jgi:hypothetical protein